MTKIVNLTPHPLVIADAHDENVASLDIPSTGIARCAQQDKEVGVIQVQNASWLFDVPIVVTKFGDVVDLPEAIEGVVYVVSSITAQACHGREDVFVPARPVRNSKGQIIACTALGRVSAADAADARAWHRLITGLESMGPMREILAACANGDGRGVADCIASALGEL